MTTITLQEAQATLSDLIHRLVPGEEIAIVVTPPLKPRQFGTLRGTVLSMEHFDDPLEGFAEYM